MRGSAASQREHSAATSAAAMCPSTLPKWQRLLQQCALVSSQQSHTTTNHDAARQQTTRITYCITRNLASCLNVPCCCSPSVSPNINLLPCPLPPPKTRMNTRRPATEPHYCLCFASACLLLTSARLNAAAAAPAATARLPAAPLLPAVSVAVTAAPTCSAQVCQPAHSSSRCTQCQGQLQPHS
jgi:hypothetical protein